MRALVPTVVIGTLLASMPASAQCFGIRCAPPSGLTFQVWVGPVVPPVWGYGYGYFYGTAYSNPWVVVPPVIAVPLPPTPGVFTLADDIPTSGGVDLAVLRQKLTADREAEQQAKRRVDGAVKRGEFVVFAPGQPLPKRAEVPPGKLTDSIRPTTATPNAPAVRMPADPAAQARYYLARGQEAFDAGELGRATERFAASVVADPKLGQAYFQLAQVRLARGQYPEAVDAIRDGMKRVPNWAEARFRADELYLGHPKRLAADMAELKAAVEANPADLTLAFLYAHHLWFGGDQPLAKKLFRNLKDKVKDQELVQPFLRD